MGFFWRAGHGRPALPSWGRSAIALFLLNLLICHRLFRYEFFDQLGSTEGAFLALSRWMLQHPHDLRWWPLWFQGMPFQNTYGPLLPAATALLAAVAKVSVVTAHHWLLALVYGIIPVLLACWLTRLSGNVIIGFVAGAIASLFSPVALVSGAIRHDTGGWLHARRLQSLVQYGDGPHLAGIALLLLTLLLLDQAVRTRCDRWFVLFACAFAACLLTNVAGAFGLAVALAAYACSQPFRTLRANLPRVLLSTAAAYGCVMPWLPPSTLLLVSANARQSAGQPWPFTWLHASGLLLLALLCLGTRRFVFHPAERFAACWLILTSGLALPALWFGFSLVPQAFRYYIEWELAAALAVGLLLPKLWRQLAVPWRISAVTIAAALAIGQTVHYLNHARHLLQPIHIEDHVEYRMARWFNAHMQGRRVFAPGSVSLWMNLWTDTPQLGGCCDQGVPHWQNRVALHTIYTWDQPTRYAALWLRAYGAHAIGVSGPGSREYFRSFAHPEQFAALPVIWREGGDAIYALPQRSHSLAHLVREADLVTRPPRDGLDVSQIERYANALNDPALPLADWTWNNAHAGTMHGNVQPGQVVSVQVSFHSGWQASSSKGVVHLGSDALGLLVLRPAHPGPQSINLSFDGGTEMAHAYLVRSITLATAAFLLVWRANRHRHAATP